MLLLIIKHPAHAALLRIVISLLDIIRPLLLLRLVFGDLTGLSRDLVPYVVVIPYLGD